MLGLGLDDVLKLSNLPLSIQQLVIAGMFLDFHTALCSAVLNIDQLQLSTALHWWILHEAQKQQFTSSTGDHLQQLVF